MIIDIHGMYSRIGAVEVYENADNGELTIKDIVGDIYAESVGFANEINTKLQSNDDVLEIQAVNVLLLTTRELTIVKSIAWAWATFETLRTENHLGADDDYKYIVEILEIPKVYKFISQEEFIAYTKAVQGFLQWDGNFYNNDEYTYEELDDFIEQLNPIYKKF